MSPYYIYFIIFTCIAYLIVTDASVARLFVLLMGIARIEYEKIKWWVLHNPANPIVKYLMWRRSWKLAKELEKEFSSRNDI
jgi:hypothetical protein